MERHGVARDPGTGKTYLPVRERGRELVEFPLLNKGTAFSLEERQQLALHGILPPAVSTIEQQLERVYENYCEQRDDLDKYLFLISLQDRNETLFYRLLLDHVEEMMPVVYTPTVGTACQRYSHIFRRPRGLYVTPDDIDHIEEILANAPSRDVAVMVVTDNAGILGLGDLGAGGMGIPIGKLVLYTAGAGIHPSRCLPVSLDVGTNNAGLLEDPLYLGLRRERITGGPYLDLIDRFVDGVRKVHPQAILQWEDFSRQNAFTVLDRHRDRLPSFNDDIQGTGALVLAGIIASLRIRGSKLCDQTVVIDGAGAAGVGIARQIAYGSVEEGTPEEEARRAIWTIDSRGLVLEDRPGLQEYKRMFARRRADIEGWKLRETHKIDLLDVVRNVKPNILIGTSGRPGQFTEEVLRAMAESDERPLIFPLSNPNSKSECHPSAALRWTGGRALVATGSPFADVEFEGRKVPVAQGNNALIFPGLGIGAVAMKARKITHGMLWASARALADTVTDERLRDGALYPSVSRFREIAQRVAVQVATQAGKDGVAEEVSEEEAARRVAAHVWEPSYLPYRPAEEE